MTMKFQSRVRIILFTVMLVSLIGTQHVPLFAQEAPQRQIKYAFVRFDTGYDEIVGAARSREYEVTEEETASRFGKYLVTLKKPQKFYSENLYLYFNEKKGLIFFTVRYGLNENESKRVIEKLVSSIQQKFHDEYGETERDTVPYYKVVEGRYEIFVKPVYVTSTSAAVSFKFLQGYDEYQGYYSVDIEREENEEIEKTLENF